MGYRSMLSDKQFNDIESILAPLTGRLYNSIDTRIDRPYYPRLYQRNTNIRTTVYIEGCAQLPFFSIDFFETSDFISFKYNIASHVDELVIILEENEESAC